MLKYNGYLFRNRLEAQWALFFDKLNVAYRYETKQRVYEETSVQPDFFLPQFDCFVKIKAEPFEGALTEDEELEGIKLLAVSTGKRVSILAGEVWLPGEPNSYSGSIFSEAEIYTHKVDEILGDESTELIQASVMVKLILQK